MTKFWKCAILALAVCVGLALGGNAYSIFFWPRNMRAQEVANAKADVRIAQEWERVRQENERLEQREELLRLEIDRLQAQTRLAQATEASARETAGLAKALTALTETINNNEQRDQLVKVLNEFNRRQKDAK